MNYLIGCALDPGTSDQKLNALIADFVKKSQTMQAAARKGLDSKEKIPPEFKAIVKRAKNSAPLVVGLISIIRTMRSSERLLTGSEAMSLFKGAVTVSSVVESRVRGLDEADVDPANEDANIVSSSQFGQGNGGKVYLLKRTDGTEVIFKGETESRTGLAGLSAANGKAYGNEQQTVNLNIAARKAAEALGMGEMIVKYTAGTHKGVFGFFMDKAKGRPAGTFAKQADQAPTPEAGLSASEIAALSPEQKRRIKAGLQRELNRLQWLDLMTGQMDRHGGNYFVHIDRDTHKVTVTGIDNDAGYSQMRTGAVTFKLDADRTAKFKLNLGTIAKTLGHPTGGKDGPNPLMKEPGITVRQDGGITVDGSKIQNRSIAAALRRTLGAQTIVVPDKIDRQTYEALMALKSDPARKAYLDSIRPRLNEECYRAAVSRLDDTIAQAERLGREGKIIENEPDGWLDVQEPERRTDEIFLENKNGQMQGLGESVSFKANITMCPSYFSRDKLGEMFA